MWEREGDKSAGHASTNQAHNQTTSKFPSIQLKKPCKHRQHCNQPTKQHIIKPHLCVVHQHVLPVAVYRHKHAKGFYGCHDTPVDGTNSWGVLYEGWAT